MSEIPPGFYTISKQDFQLGLMVHYEDASVYMVPKHDEDSDREWELQTLPNGNVIISNPTTEKFLSLLEGPFVNEPVTVEADKPDEWQLRQSSEPNSFFIVVPGGPVDGHELTLDYSLMRAYPPRVALRPLEHGGEGQAWRLDSVQ